jgi:hypothetical protein
LPASENGRTTNAAESIGMHFVCEYPDETNGITHVSAISRERWLNEITERAGMLSDLPWKNYLYAGLHL